MQGVGAIIRSDDTVFGEDESTVAEGAEDGEEGMGGMQVRARGEGPWRGGTGSGMRMGSMEGMICFVHIASVHIASA